MTVTIQPETLADVRLVDCDSHFTEPPDLWSSRAPASMGVLRDNAIELFNLPTASA